MRKIQGHFVLLTTMTLLALSLKAPASAQVAGTSGADDLVVVQNGATQATVVVADNAGTWEKQAATDLAKYIGLMSGATPPVVNAVPGANTPVFIVGQASLAA